MLKFTRFAAFLMLIPIYLGMAYGSDSREVIEKILTSPKRGEFRGDVFQQHADDLLALQVDVFPGLAELLIARQYGYDAAETMIRLDSARALPLILKAVPQSDRDVQNLGFREFLNRNFGLPCDTTCPLAYESAIAVITNESSPEDSVELALYVVGLTGTERDFPLLEEVRARNRGETRWELSERSAAEAALAKLGSTKYSERIKAQLQRKSPKQLSLDEAYRIEAWLLAAGFVGEKEFIPLVCRHLQDPDVWEGDMGTTPSIVARSQLVAIVRRTTPFRINSETTNFTSACQN